MYSKKGINFNDNTSNATSPLISVITVVYNGEATLENTILSVIGQSYSNLEYIIIDGGSVDGTIDIIKRYNDSITYWVSETDTGIYEAMNKGINKASGDLINFMNAGDLFFDHNVIEDVVKRWAESDYPDILFGNSWIVYNSGFRKKIISKNNTKELWKGPTFRHGAMFVKSELAKEFPFNLNKNYTICADFDFIYHMHVIGKRFVRLDRDILCFQANGVSSDYYKGVKNNRMVVLSYSPKKAYKRWYIRSLLKGVAIKVGYNQIRPITDFGYQLFCHYMPNNIITYIPSYKIRHFYYKFVCGINIAHGASIHMRTFIMGRRIFIGPNSVINRSCYLDGRDELKIGSNVSISPYVHIITGTHDLESTDFRFVSKPVIIEDYVWIGSRATILPGVIIGEGSVIGVGSVVTTNVEPYTIVAGVPAHKIRNRTSGLDYNPKWFPWFD